MGNNRKVKYLDDLDIVTVETCGSYVLGQEIETLKSALAVAKEKNCCKLLFDHRNAAVQIKTMEAYNRPSVYEELGFNRSVRLASLVVEKDDNLIFYETVCRNRGWQMRIFNDYKTALAWLKEI